MTKNISEILKSLKENYKDRPENFIKANEINYVVDYDDVKSFIKSEFEKLLEEIPRKKLYADKSVVDTFEDGYNCHCNEVLEAINKIKL